MLKRFPHIILLISMVLCFVTSSLGQRITIVDANGAPLQLVNVISNNPEALSISKADGEVDLDPFKDADSIIISRVGFGKKLYSYAELTQLQNGKLIFKRSSVELEEFVISSSKWKQSTSDVPQKIVKIDPTDVHSVGAQTTADMLHSSGEVYVQKSQLGGGSPMIRGFSANRVMINVDGVRMNNAIFRSGNLQNVISIDPNVVDNIEVNLGPGSVIYGSDAIGGVMSFYTLNPEFADTSGTHFSGRGMLRASSANSERTGHAHLKFGTKRWASVTSFTQSEYGNQIMGSDGPRDYLRSEYVLQLPDGVTGSDTILRNPNPNEQVYTGYKQASVMQKIAFKASDHSTITYSGQFSQTSDIPRYDRLTQYDGDTLRYAEWYYGPQEWMLHSIKAELDKKTKMYDAFSIVGAFQHFKESRNSRTFQSTQLIRQEEELLAFSANLDWKKEINARHMFYYGIEWIGNQVNSSASTFNIVNDLSSNTQSRYPDGSTWMSSSIYVSDQFRMSERITLLGGLRYTNVQINADFDTTFYKVASPSLDLNTGALNGSLGMAYKPEQTWQFNLNASTGFRAPNIDDVGKVFDSQPLSVTLPNADLKPEMAYNLEAGITKVFKDLVKVEASAFYTFLDRAMVRRNTTLDGADSILYNDELSRVQSIQNAASAFVYGGFFGAEIKISKRFSTTARLNYQRGEEETNDGVVSTLRHAAPIFGYWGLKYSTARLKAEAYAEYNGEIKAEDLPINEQAKPHLYALNAEGLPYSPSWYTLNVKATYDVNEKISMSGALENLLDRRYRAYSSGISAPGRNVSLSLVLKF